MLGIFVLKIFIPLHTGTKIYKIPSQPITMLMVIQRVLHEAESILCYLHKF